MKASELREELDELISEFGDADIYITANEKTHYINESKSDKSVKAVFMFHADNKALWYRLSLGETVPYREIRKKYAHLLPELGNSNTDKKEVVDNVD